MPPLQVQYFINPLLKFMNILIISLPHSLVPVIGIPFDPVANAIKGLLAYGLIGLIIDTFDYFVIWYSLNG